MSSSHNTYIGPYVVAKCHEAPTPVPRQTCPDTTCQNHGKPMPSVGYCPLCGKKIADVSFVEGRPTVSWGDMIETLNERMRCTDQERTTHYWFSNLQTMDELAGRDLSVEEDDAAYPITPAMMDAETKAFEKLHAAEIEKLRQAYDSVEVIWGVLTYWI